MNSSGHCIVLKGSSGSGKTTVFRALAESHGKQDGRGLITLHLGEQVDSKVGVSVCALKDQVLR